jgi:GTP cyclohydrolase I
MKTDDRIKEAAFHYSNFMKSLGIPIDENSADTAMRVARMMVNERCSSLYEDPPKLTFFPRDNYDEYVVVKDIPYISVCAHHHVSFYGKAHVAYHPKKNVVGISKIARVVAYFSAKPQIQELMTTEIIDHLFSGLKPHGIMVRLEGTHLCMTGRGARAMGSKTITQAIRGKMDKREVEKLFQD